MWTGKRLLTLLVLVLVTGCEPLVVLGPSVIVTSPLPVAAALHSQPSGDLTAFINVNVVTLETEQILWQQTVLVANQRIVAIGPVDQVDVPDGAHRIAGAGKFLMPGLADMHVHLRKDYYLLLLLHNGVTLVRNMDGLPIHLTWRAEIAAGQRLGPQIFTTGPIMDELPYYLPGPRPFSTGAGADQSVAEQKALGYDYIKVHDGLSGSAYQNIMTAARVNNIPVVGHVPDGLRVFEVITAGQRSLEHLDGYFNVYADQLSTLLTVLVDREVWSVPTLTCFQLLTPTSGPPTVFQQALLTAVPDLATEFWWMPADFAEVGYVYAPVSPAKLHLVATLQAAGAPLLLGTDAPFPYAIPGFAVVQELENLVAAGLTPYAALRTATYNAACAVNRLDDLGTVTVGKRADLLLVNANPLADVRNVRQISGVMVQGRWLPHAETTALLRQAAADRQATLP